MRRGQVVVTLVAIAAIVAIALLSSGDDGGGDGGQEEAREGAVRVSFVYSPEKEELVKPLVERFNDEGADAGGRPVFVEARAESSGEAERAIARDRLKPVLWSPASSLWGRLLNFEADAAWVDDENPSLVRTPLVIAMWEPLARALGWPRKAIGFADVLKLARSERGWAEYGRPEFGRFKLGHTNPDFSTSGLSAVAAEYYAATGKKEGLSVSDVERPKVRATIKGIERSIVHYGDTTLFFSDQLKRYGPAYASAVAMEEVTLVEFNRGRRGTKLVGIYPAEGTFFSDNPLIIPRAPWVSAVERAAAEEFIRWLQEEVTPQVAARGGFRPGDPNAKPLPPVARATGADPKQPKRVLSLPEPRVMDRIRTAWREDRKPANVMLVVDVSGSMSEEDKLEQAKTGLQAFLREISPADRVGLMSFNDRVFPLEPVRRFATNEAALRRAVQDLLPDGETALYDATGAGVEAVRKMRDDSRINAVVVLSDGQDTASKASADAVARELEAQSRAEGLGVRVFAIAYGSEADMGVLERLARAAGGKAFEGDPEEIEAVYRNISSFF
jgi:Ca-activated chloride channel homolog